MIIKSNDLISSKKGLLMTEVLSSLTDDDYGISIINEEGAYVYDVKLLINGQEREPNFLIGLLTNLEEYIDKEATSLVSERMENIEREVNELKEKFIEDLKEKLF